MSALSPKFQTLKVIFLFLSFPFLWLCRQQNQQYMSNRYEKINLTMLFQQQKHHYEQIQNARTTLKVDEPPRKSYSLYRNNKTQHQRDRVLKIQNRKMLQALLTIYNHKPGLLSQHFEGEDQQKLNQKRRSFYSSLKKEQIQRSIRKKNQDICTHLINAEPVVGNHKEWDQHFSQHLKMEKRLCNRTSNEYFDFNQMRSSLRREKKRQTTIRSSKDQPTPKTIDDKNSVALLMNVREKRRKKFKRKNKKSEQIKGANHEQ